MDLPPCSDSSRAREEPLAATASRVERWLVVEHRGPWGPEAPPTARMELRVARRLAELAQQARARLLLVRRPAGVDCPQGRAVYAAESRPGSEALRRTHVLDDEQLLDLRPFADPQGWTPVAEPLYLVCTHGRHDRCCAVRGRPVAQALSQVWPEQVWEVSHIGGDRFAPNLLVLPEGLYVGRLEPEVAVAVVEALERGELPLPHLRGRSSLPLPSQAAQQFARERYGRVARDDLFPVAQEVVQDDVWRVRLSGPGGPDVLAVVRYVREGAPEVLSCGADPKVAPTFACLSLQAG